MICNKCNHKLPDDSEFCQYCGNKIESAEIVETFNPNTTELIEELNNPDITSDDALSAILKFQAKATIDAMEANANSQPDNESDEDFGLVPEKPIFTLALKSVDGEEEYLDKLRTESGERIKYTRRGSTSAAGINGMIDIYDTFLPSGQPYKTIYINMYGVKASVSAPKGFKFVTAKASTPVKKAALNVEKVNKPQKQVNKKLLIAIISSSFAIVMLMIPLFFLLFHIHDYQLSSYNAPTCIISGSKVYECSRCKHSYTEIVPSSHQYIISEQNDSTCTSQGKKTVRCSVCHDTHSETIPIKSHNYSHATCTKPQTCLTCGETNGTALGHTSGATCSRCGEVTFKTLTYTGTGSKIIKNIIVPNGRFVISGYAIKTYENVGSFYVYLYYANGNIAAFWIDSLYSGNQTLEKAVSFDGAVNGGILEIQAGDNISWTITIEAVGN